MLCRSVRSRVGGAVGGEITVWMVRGGGREQGSGGDQGKVVEEAGRGGECFGESVLVCYVRYSTQTQHSLVFSSLS